VFDWKCFTQKLNLPLRGHFATLAGLGLRQAFFWAEASVCFNASHLLYIIIIKDKAHLKCKFLLFYSNILTKHTFITL
jgi:hypothetical protein